MELSPRRLSSLAQNTFALEKQLHMRRITIPFIDTNLNIPIIKISCGTGNDLFVLVDTGSESTIVEKAIVNEYPKIEYRDKQYGKQSMIGVSGKYEVPVVCALVRVGINSGEETKGYLEFNGTMCTMGKLQDSFKEKFGFNIAMLVGSDFLIRQNARIDMKKKELSILVKTGTRGIKWKREQIE